MKSQYTQGEFRMYSNVALYLTIDGQRKFVGKHIGNTIYRDFPFSKAKLRKGDALGSDIRLLEYARYHNVAGFVFTDPKKKVSLAISIDNLEKHYFESEENPKEGRQFRVNMEHLKKIKHIKTDYTNFEREIRDGVTYERS